MDDLPLRNLDEEMGRTRVRQAPGDSRRDKWVRWQGAIDRDSTNLATHRMASREQPQTGGLPPTRSRITYSTPIIPKSRFDVS